MNRSIKLAGALWAALQFTACEQALPTEPTQEPPSNGGAETISISEVGPLVPGAETRVTGQNLDKLTSLSVGGEPVTFDIVSATEVRVSVPEMRTCETDGRPVSLVANGTVSSSGRVRVEQTVQLAVGESRVLAAEDLYCLQLAAAAEEYVLSVHSFSRSKAFEDVLSLRTPGMAGGASFLRGGVAPAQAHAPNEVVWSHSAQRVLSQMGAGDPSAAWDPRYSTAKVGDMLEFVDWRNRAWLEATSRDEVPTYQGLVVAASGSQLIVVDQRLPDARAFDLPEVRARLAAAAEIADKYSLKAIHSVIDPSYQPLQGAGGRTISMIMELPEGILGGVHGYDLAAKTEWSYSSEMPVVALDVMVKDLSPGVVSATIIHEQAHIADHVSYSRGGELGSMGWFSEALAVNVEEAAARMALGREVGARPDEVVPERIPISEIIRSPSLRPDMESPFGPEGSSDGVGGLAAYDRGARLLHYARERLGETGFEHGGSRLYQRLKERASKATTFEDKLAAWSIDAIAADLGLSAETLMEEASLAELTDDLVAVGAPHSLPQIRSWDHSMRAPGRLRDLTGGQHLIERGEAFAGDARLPGGTHRYWYVTADNPDQGVSIERARQDLQPHHRVRLTRLR